MPLTVQPSGDGRDATATVESVQLRYRHVNQAERYEALEMTRDGSAFQATIPPAYTESPYPLQYFFVVRWRQNGTRQAALYPGLGPDLTNQPHYLIRQAPSPDR